MDANEVKLWQTVVICLVTVLVVLILCVTADSIVGSIKPGPRESQMWYMPK